jgi:hypothetical protein
MCNAQTERRGNGFLKVHISVLWFSSIVGVLDETSDCIEEGSV